MPTLVTWHYAPDWLTPPEAAALLGPLYSAETVTALIDLGAVDAEHDAAGGWLVEKRSLREYQEAYWEVWEDEQ